MSELKNKALIGIISFLLVGCSQTSMQNSDPNEGIGTLTTVPADERYETGTFTGSISNNADIIGVMPERTKKNTLYIVNNKSKSITKFVSNRELYRLSVSANGQKFAFLRKEAKEHTLSIIVCNIDNSTCESVIELHRELVTSTSISPNGDKLYYSAINVPAFKLNPDKFIGWNKYEIYKYNSTADDNSYGSNIYLLNLKTKESKLIVYDIPLHFSIKAYDSGFSYNGFISFEQRANFVKSDLFKDSSLKFRGLPIHCDNEGVCDFYYYPKSDYDALQIKSIDEYGNIIMNMGFLEINSSGRPAWDTTFWHIEKKNLGIKKFIIRNNKSIYSQDTFFNFKENIFYHLVAKNGVDYKVTSKNKDSTWTILYNNKGDYEELNFDNYSNKIVDIEGS
jgi:hypothetical protein